MDLNKKNKNLNLIFRLCVIACAVCTVIGIVSIILFVIDAEKYEFEEAFLTGRFNKFLTSMKMYLLVSWVTVLNIVLSILAWRTEHYGSVAMRTICLIIVAVLLFSGYKTVSTLNDAAEIMSVFKVENVDALTEEEIIAKGYTLEEFDKIDKTMENFDDEELFGFLRGYVGAGIVYFILFFTSIVSLIKIKALYMMASDPTNSPEYYAAMAMNNQNAAQGMNGYGGGKDLIDGGINTGYAPVNSNFANNGNYNGFGGAPVNNGQFGNGYPNQPMNNGYNNAPMNNGFGDSPMNNGYGNAPMNNGYNAPQMNGSFGNSPMNNSGMGTMEEHFNTMNQNGGYNNGNFSNQSYTGSGISDDLDDDDL